MRSNSVPRERRYPWLKADKHASTATATARPKMVRAFRSGRRTRFRNASSIIINGEALPPGRAPGWLWRARLTRFARRQRLTSQKRVRRAERWEYPVQAATDCRHDGHQTTEATGNFAVSQRLIQVHAAVAGATQQFV